jgi:FlgD Ig-like domain
LSKLAPTAISLALLGGAAIAFAVSERLKLEPTPVTGTRVDKVFSPVCECPSSEATIAFELRKPARLTVEILDRDDDVVRTLVAGQRFGAGELAFRWDGRDGEGRIVPEASYRPRVELRDRGRTIVLPNPIRVDITRPRLSVIEFGPQLLSPDGDGRHDRLRVLYRVSEPAHGLLFVDDRQEIRTRFKARRAKFDWFGVVNGRRVAPGRYEIAVAAEDLAGNRSSTFGPKTVMVRYVELARETIRVRARLRFGVRVKTDAPMFRWRFARATGTARPGLLVLRAPRKPGRYTLYVAANGHGDRALVRVRPRR